MCTVTVNIFSNLTVNRLRNYAKNLMRRTPHRSKHFWVQIWFLCWKRSSASASVFVVFGAETLALSQVFSEKFRSFSSVSEKREFVLQVDLVNPLSNTHTGDTDLRIYDPRKQVGPNLRSGIGWL